LTIKKYTDLFKWFLLVNMASILTLKGPRAMGNKRRLHASERPDLLPELGEAVDGPIIQVIIGFQGLIVLLVNELQELPHVAFRRVLVHPQGLARGLRGLHGLRVNGGDERGEAELGKPEQPKEGHEKE
jgi:hypothetical protein